ncbi:Developmentally-regulated GTP-binding protein 1 [Dictyocoela muelleri]|nr:Developmentally-regulated GTP-binding protein 1 [Dictyocoela muelleri]
MNTLDKIKSLETEISTTKKNKSTETHLALLKAKLSKLRKDLLITKQSSKNANDAFEVSKTGVARIGFIGFPSVGKSTLMSALTGTYSQIAEYEFTTLTTIPGILNYNNAKIQLLDLPGIIEGACDGKGRGKQVLSVARTCSLLLVVLDATKSLILKKKIENELTNVGIRINKEKPNLKVTRRSSGGINITGEIYSEYNNLKENLKDNQKDKNFKDKKYNFKNNSEPLDHETIKQILREYKINNAEVIGTGSLDDLIDTIESTLKITSLSYIPTIYVINKIDKISLQELRVISQLPNSICISSNLNWNFPNLLKMIWNKLDLIRVFPKPKNKKIDDDPIVLKRKKSKILDFCNSIHKDILNKFKYALVWGSSVKHNPQKVGKDHQLNDGDVVQIVKDV